MLKIKSIKSIKKRIKKTSSGKLKFKCCNLRHILTKKKKRRKRKLKKKKIVNKTISKKIKKINPYL